MKTLSQSMWMLLPVFFAACDSNMTTDLKSSGSKNCKTTALTSKCPDNIAVSLSFASKTDEQLIERSVLIDFDEAVTGFEVKDFLISNGEIVSLAGSDEQYTAKIRAKVSGDVKISVAEAAVTSVAAGYANLASNEIEWSYAAASQGNTSTNGQEPTAPSTYLSPIMDVTEWQTDPSALHLSSYPENYRRAKGYRHLNIDEAQVVVGAYTYRWTREADTYRGWALFKTPATFNADVLGTKLLQLCASTKSAPSILTQGTNNIYFVADGNCDGLNDIIILHKPSEMVTVVQGTFMDIANGCAIGDKIIFAAETQAEGYEIWSSDGTVSGTNYLITPNAGTAHTFLSGCGTASSYVGFFYTVGSNYYVGKWTGSSAPTTGAVTGFSSIHSLKGYGNYVYFSGSKAANGVEVWRTDGTVGGTVLYKDIYVGVSSSNPTFHDLANGHLLMAGQTSTGCKISKTDGTTITDYSVNWPNCTSVKEIREYGGLLYLSLAGTTSEKYSRVNLALDQKEDFLAGSNTVNVFQFNFTQGNFCVNNGAMSMPNFVGGGLLKIDSSHGITSIASQFFAHLSSSFFFYMDVSTTRLGLSCAYTNFGDSFFKVNSDLTLTELRKGVRPWQPHSGRDYVSDLVLYSFFADQGDRLQNYRYKLKSVDRAGTSVGLNTDSTTRTGTLGNLVLYVPDDTNVLYSWHKLTGVHSTVKDLTVFSGLNFAHYLGAGPTYAYFITNVGLLRSDGTAGGTILVTASIDNSYSNVVTLGAYDYFIGVDQSFNYGVYRTNGSSGNISKIITLTTDSGQLIPYQAGFLVSTVTGGPLKYYNGTTTVDIVTDSFYNSSVVPSDVKVLGNEIFYSLVYGYSNVTRHRKSSDGSYQNAHALWSPHGLDLNIFEALVLGGYIYVPAMHATSGMGIWRFNMDFTSPVEIKNLKNGTVDASVQYFELRGSRIFFSSNAGGDGLELWVSDGTTGGTSLVQELVTNGGSDPYPLNMTSDNKIFVTAESGANTRGLYLVPLP